MFFAFRLFSRLMMVVDNEFVMRDEMIERNKSDEIIGPSSD